MRIRFSFLLIAITVLCAGLAPTAAAKLRPHKLRLPSVLTDGFRADVIAQAPKPKEGPEDIVFKSCPGVGPTVPGVQAGTCLVDPYGCTANFVYYNGAVVTDATGALRPAGGTGLPPFTSDGAHWYLGTAGHCLKAGPVLAQVRPPGVYLPDSDAGGIAAIGTTDKKMNAGIGKDFGSIKLYAGQLVTPASPIGGPKGIYTQCVPNAIDYWGHGYHFAVAQGKGGGGGAFYPSTLWYTWAGTTFGGDSGSGVMLGSTLAVGDLTHGLGIDVVPLPIGYGTRMTEIMRFLGSGYYLVNADGTLSRETTTCAGTASPWDELVGVRRGKKRS